MNVAQFWKESISIVENVWSYVDYVDRREYMFISGEIQHRFDDLDD